MRSLGFREDPEEDAPICRWLFPSAIKLDLMPTDPSILGFTNRWFADALRTAQPHKLPSGTRIRIVTAPYFLATKIEAFHSRGSGDYMGSTDIEDLVAVLHGREEIVEEVRAAEYEVRRYLEEQAYVLLQTHEFVEALCGHLPGEDTTRVTDRLARISGEFAPG